MMARRFVALALAALSIGALAVAVGHLNGRLPERTLPTGKVIEPPSGASLNVGSFPVNMTVSPDGRFAIVTNSGFREQVSVIDMAAQKVVSKVDFNGNGKGLYFGLACYRGIDGTTHVAVSRGAEDKISLFTLGDDGVLTAESTIDLPGAENPLHIPRHIAGIAWNDDGTKLLAVANQSHVFNGWHGSVLTIDAASHAVLGEEKVGSFPARHRGCQVGDLRCQ